MKHNDILNTSIDTYINNTTKLSISKHEKELKLQSTDMIHLFLKN